MCIFRPSCERCMGGTHRDLAGVGLILRVRDGAILLDDHGPAAIAVTNTGLPSVVLRELGLVVAEEVLIYLLATSLAIRKERTYDGLLSLVNLAPCVHDESVVEGNDSNSINTLGLQLIELLNVRRDVEGLATGSESA